MCASASKTVRAMDACSAKGSNASEPVGSSTCFDNTPPFHSNRTRSAKSDATDQVRSGAEAHSASGIPGGPHVRPGPKTRDPSVANGRSAVPGDVHGVEPVPDRGPGPASNRRGTGRRGRLPGHAGHGVRRRSRQLRAGCRARQRSRGAPPNSAGRKCMDGRLASASRIGEQLCDPAGPAGPGWRGFRHHERRGGGLPGGRPSVQRARTGLGLGDERHGVRPDPGRPRWGPCSRVGSAFRCRSWPLAA